MSTRVSNLRSSLLRPLLSLAPLGLAMLGGVGGCDKLREQDMHYQARNDPYEASTFFADGMSARPQVPGTVARRKLYGAEYYKNAQPGPPLRSETHGGGFPPGFPPSDPQKLRDTLARGQERYNIYCAPCHGFNGLGDGMIVQRGFTKPPSFVVLPEDRVTNPQRYDREVFLQTAPPEHYYNVITNGLGAMYSYAERVKPEDRWAIIAYVKAIQAAKPAPTGQGPSATIGADQTRTTGH